MTAREEYRAVEARLAVVVAQIEDSASAGREIESPRYQVWSYADSRAVAVRERILPLATVQALLLERERLQAESFRLWQRMRAEAPSV